jgi:hypothetical protein
MSDGEIRELVDGEPPIIVEAAVGIIADRRAEQAGSEQTSWPAPLAHWGHVRALVEQLAANLRRDRVRYLVAFVELRSELRQTTDSDFDGGAVERSQALDETEHDYVALVAAGAEAAQLDAQFESADREASDREADLAALVVAQLQELVTAVAGRLP